MDRSGCCYNCIFSGHKAKDCRGKQHCAICATKGLSATHRTGGDGCHSNKKASGKKEAPRIEERKSQPQRATGVKGQEDPRRQGKVGAAAKPQAVPGGKVASRKEGLKAPTKGIRKGQKAQKVKEVAMEEAR